MKKAVFYHAGCSVCIDAEKKVLDLVDTTKYELEVVNFPESKDRISEAESLGVKSVPALLIDQDVLHINFGASMEDVKAI